MTGHKNRRATGGGLLRHLARFHLGPHPACYAGKADDELHIHRVAYFARKCGGRDRDRLFIEQPPALQIAVLLTMFIGFNFDEGDFLRSVDTRRCSSPRFSGGAPAPGNANAICSTFWSISRRSPCFSCSSCLPSPAITRATTAISSTSSQRCLGARPADARSDYGLVGRFTIATLYANFLALVGTSFVPDVARWPVGSDSGRRQGALAGKLVVGVSVVPMLTAMP